MHIRVHCVRFHDEQSADQKADKNVVYSKNIVNSTIGSANIIFEVCFLLNLEF